MVVTPVQSGPSAVVGLEPAVGYRELLRLRYTVRLLGSTLTGRLPNAMAPSAVLMAAAQERGSLAAGGGLAGAYLVAFAVGQPVLGRCADRFGFVLPLLGGAVCAAACLGALAWFGTASLPLALAWTIAAGLFNPPLEGCLRVLWPTVLPGSQAARAAYLRVAYALDNGSQEAVYVVGPLLAGALAALSPQAALGGTALLGLGGAFSLGCSRPARVWVPACTGGRGRWLGPLASPAVQGLLVTMVCAGTAVGALRVCALAHAQHSGALWLRGALPTLFSLGGLVGGLLYGARGWWGAPVQHLRLLAVGGAVAWLPMLALPTPGLAALLVTLPGVCFTTMLCVGCLLLNAAAPPGTGAEAFGWLIAAVNAGLALGSAVAGMAGGSYAVCLLAAAAAAAVLAATGGRLQGRHGAVPLRPCSGRGGLAARDAGTGTEVTAVGSKGSNAA
ncbi:transporter [Streptomyces sp. NPDC059003]|uniref:transporter n=1 Tax=Streptomyces sp. NPDC059003 TaxID=3346691 RepID=UPI003691CD25